jgi:pimeloyl-ACP methyl ester carboxylesterase
MPFLRVRDVRLYYEDREPPGEAGRRAPLLLLHGLGSSARDWRAQMDFFSKTRRVFALDLRGHGRSGAPPGPYSISLFAGDAADAVRRLGLGDPDDPFGGVHVAGLSMGGMVALQLALDAPALVRSLTVVNSGVDCRARTPRQRRRLWQRRLALRFLSMRRVGALLGRRLFPTRPDLQYEMTERWAANDPAAYRASFEAVMDWSVRARVPDIAAPTLVVAADGDYLPLSSYRAYAGRIPGAELAVLEGTRHAAPVEAPEVFNEVLGAFLRQVEGDGVPRRPNVTPPARAGRR